MNSKANALRSNSINIANVCGSPAICHKHATKSWLTENSGDFHTPNQSTQNKICLITIAKHVLLVALYIEQLGSSRNLRAVLDRIYDLLGSLCKYKLRVVRCRRWDNGSHFLLALSYDIFSFLCARRIVCVLSSNTKVYQRLDYTCVMIYILLEEVFKLHSRVCVRRNVRVPRWSQIPQT